MIVPNYWAEARLRHIDPEVHGKGRQITVRRFGWSDEGLEAAQAMADERAQLALERIRGGEQLPRREPKVAYNGAEGVPIREEVLERAGDSVITRNMYGAHCLNTPSALFADIDFPEESTNWLIFALVGVLAAALFAGVLVNPLLGIGIFILGFVAVGYFAWLQRRRDQHKKATPEDVANAAIDRFVAAHPDWHLRVYRTPAGLRALAMHRQFSTADSAVAELFSALAVDPRYALMCQRQHCFRARLTAKPWRMKFHDRMKPPGGVWPIVAARLAERERWTRQYDAEARGFAACRYVRSVGASQTDPEVDRVRELHDQRCCALTELPLA